MLADLLARHNQQRTQAGLDALKINTKLMQAAQMQAQYMTTHNKTGHQGRNGTTPAQRVTQQGYHAVKVGENVADGRETSEAVVQAWMHSPPHRQNILGSFTEIGVARATNTQGHPYRCVVFGVSFPDLDARGVGRWAWSGIIDSSRPILKMRHIHPKMRKAA